MCLTASPELAIKEAEHFKTSVVIVVLVAGDSTKVPAASAGG